MNRTTGWVFFAFAFVEAILLISTMDYKIALEQENDRLKRQLAPKDEPNKEVYEAVLCPPDWYFSMRQRHDKRRWDGVITHKRWRGVCV